MSEEAVHPDSINGAFVLKARPGVAAVELEGEGLLYDEQRASWHLLSPTAMVIWQCCDGSGTVDDLARDLAQAYQADLGTVRAGTFEAVRELGHQGLLEGVEGDEPDVDPHRAHAHGDHDGAYDLPPDPPNDGPRFLPVPPSG